MTSDHVLDQVVDERDERRSDVGNTTALQDGRNRELVRPQPSGRDRNGLDQIADHDCQGHARDIERRLEHQDHEDTDRDVHEPDHDREPPRRIMERTESETVRISSSIWRMIRTTRFSLWIRPANMSTAKKIAPPISGTTIRA